MANEPAILPSSLVEVMARLDAGESRSDLLIEFGLQEASFLEAQRRWLAVIGAAVLRGDFKLQRHYAAEYSVHFERASAQPPSYRPAASRSNASPDESRPSSEPPLVATGMLASGRQDELPPASARPSEPRFVEPQFVEPKFVEPLMVTPPPVVSAVLVPPAVVPVPPVVPPVVPAMVAPPPVAPALVTPSAVVEPPLFKSPQAPNFSPPSPFPSYPKAEPAEPPVAQPPTNSPVPSPGAYQRMPAGMGGTVSFSDTGFGIAPVMGVTERPSPPGVTAPPPEPPVSELQNVQGSGHAEPPIVPGMAPSPGQSRPRVPSLKPLPQHLNFMSGGSGATAPNSTNGMPGAPAAFGGPPAVFGGPAAGFGGPPAAFGGFPPPGLGSPLPPSGAAFSGAVPASLGGGAFPRPAGSGVAQPVNANWSAPTDFSSPVRGGLPPVPSQTSSVNTAATATNPLSLEQLACIQAELDVNPDRLGELLQVNGVDEPSYHAQSSALHNEMVSNPEKARRFEQLREYYRAIFSTPR